MTRLASSPGHLGEGEKKRPGDEAMTRYEYRLIQLYTATTNTRSLHRAVHACIMKIFCAL